MKTSASSLWQRALAVLIACTAVACSVSETTETRTLERVGGDSGAVMGRLPACEPGQVAVEGGRCQDVVVTKPDGTTQNLRMRSAADACARSEGYVRASARRRQNLMAGRGHEIHLALTAINNECRLRGDEIEACERAAQLGAESLTPSELLRRRERLSACQELANLYRKMLAQGLRRAP